VQIDNTKTVQQLSGNKIDTISPYGKSLETEIGGLTKSNDTAIPKFQLLIQGTNISSNVCISVSDIEMEIKMEQTVYIPSKHTKDSCMYKQVMIHEMKHVETNNRIIEKYAPMFEAKLKEAADKLGVVSVSKRNLNNMNIKISNYLKQAVSALFSRMQAEKIYEQQKIDTLAEYERVRRACRR